MAMAKAQAKDVKQLGQRLVADHENADRMVRELAKQEGVRLETEPPPLVAPVGTANVVRYRSIAARAHALAS